MEIKGTVKQLLPEVTGTSSKGLWKKRDVIIETAESYPKSVCITFWSELCDKSNGFKIGQTITVHFNLESREYNGRWYTEVRAWKFDDNSVQQTKPAIPAEPEPIEPTNNEDQTPLPF